MKKLLAILWLTVSFAQAQDQSTPNLITSGTAHTWSGVTTGSIPSGCATAGPCPGGPAPIYDPSTNTISFSYNSQAVVAQTIAINNALANVGAGVRISGYNYSYDIRNMNGDNRQGGIDTINVYQSLIGTNGSSLLSSQQTYNTKFEWTSISGGQIAVNTIAPSDASYLQFKMIGGDNGYWGGYFGPQVRNVNMSLRYVADICASDPLSSVNCSGYAVAYLSLQCSGNPLYSAQCPGYAQAYFTQQCTVNALYDPSCPGYANAYLTYQCSINPLYATTGVGYDQAYFNQQCSINPLYNSRCSGYDQAYLTQQCDANPLYASTCSGYGQAYFNQQCSINPLYNVGCVGYTQAYHNQQCSINALFATDCPGYQVAFKNQQCSVNALFATDCPGYADAYFNQQCSLNSLYNQLCPNYTEAYAKKMLLEKQGIASLVSTAGTIAALAPTSTTTIAVVADPIVNQTVTSTSTSASPAQAATAIVPLVVAPVVEQTKPQEKVADKPANVQPIQQAQGNDKPQPSARQQLAERRAEAAKKDAVEKGKNLANEMGKAADMEAQKHVQNVVIQAMGFTPGFDAYGKVMVPDVQGYKPFTVYNNQKNVDNARLGRRLMGPSDQLHDELVNSQWDMK